LLSALLAASSGTGSVDISEELEERGLVGRILPFHLCEFFFACLLLQLFIDLEEALFQRCREIPVLVAILRPQIVAVVALSVACHLSATVTIKNSKKDMLLRKVKLSDMGIFLCNATIVVRDRVSNQ
jgi:hypothetical protein